MKRIFCLLLAACLLVTLGGCGTVAAAPQGGATPEWSSDADKNAEIMAQEIIRCLIEKDQEGLSSLFCKSARSGNGFTQQLGNLYGMFNYDSYVGCRSDDIRSFYGEEGDREILRMLRAEIIYIEVVETGADGKEVSKFYGLDWYWVLTCEDDPDLVGIHQLTIRLLNTDQSITVGNLDSWLIRGE